MIVVTGATGQFGRQVVERLMQRNPTAMEDFLRRFLSQPASES